MSECMVKPGEREECCCRCKWLAIDASHPHTDGKRVSDQRGWVCLAPEFTDARMGGTYPIVCSGWSEHGLCEMFEERETRATKAMKQGEVPI